MAEPLIEPIPWDSRFFGLRIGRGRPRTQEPKEWMDLLTLARQDGYQLLYLNSGRPLPLAIDAAWADLLPMGPQILLGRPLRRESDDEQTSAPPERWTHHECSEELRLLARVSGMCSRFRLDPNLAPESCERLYDTWMEASVAGRLADGVYVHRHGNAMAGVITARWEQDVCRIGLLAVAAEARGRGVGRNLIRAVEQEALQQGCSRIEVLTQGRNTGACRFYSRCGLRLVEQHFAYHCWLAEQSISAGSADEPDHLRPAQHSSDRLSEHIDQVEGIHAGRTRHQPAP